MRFVIITGMSGAGKSYAVRYLEDINYYCIDNMPPALVYNFAEICHGIKGKFEQVAVVCDIRGGSLFDDFQNMLKALAFGGFTYEVLFLDASTEALVNRFKETRRKHPIHSSGLLTDSIAEERELLSVAKEKANYIIDTSAMTALSLRNELNRIFSTETPQLAFAVNVLSFGFKYGLPVEADLVFDVRFMPNPFYVRELKALTGLDKAVSDFVMSFDESKTFAAKLFDMIDFLLPYYIEEGKNQLVIAIGCTGGKHRSVTIAERLTAHLNSSDVNVAVMHRDIDKR